MVPSDGKEARSLAVPDFKTPAGWETVSDLAEVGGSRVFVTGDINSHLLRISYFKRVADKNLVGHVWFGKGSEGPPAHAHGGAIAGIFDEVMGAAAWFAGHPILAARVAVDFLAPAPLGTTLHYETGISGIEGKRVLTTGAILHPDGKIIAKADGVFVKVSREKIALMRGQ